MLKELIEVANELYKVSDRLKQSKDEERQRIVKYFYQIQICLEGIAKELNDKKSPHSKWGELKEYATGGFPASISGAIGIEKSEELSQLLARIVDNTSEDSSDNDIKAIETTAGRFKALAEKVSIEEEGKKQKEKETSNLKMPSSIPVSRRDLIIIGATAISATAGWYASQYKQSINWTMVSFLGDSAKDRIILYKAPQMICDRIKAITNNYFNIQLDTSGKIQTQDILNQVSAGKEVQCGFSGVYYIDDRYRPLYFGCAIPFGLSPQEQTAWLLYKKGDDDLTFMQNLYRKLGLNVIPFPAGATGGQMGGWFKKKVESIGDFKPLAMRIPGLGADVLAKYFSVTTDATLFGKAISPNEISDNLKEGRIQAAEWIGPHDDYKLNLHEAGANYYYYPGWWEPSTTFDVQVNVDAWGKLPPEYKKIFEAVCFETYTKILSEYDQENSQLLEKIRSLGRIEILPFSDEILLYAQASTQKLLKSYDANDDFKKVHNEWKNFKERIQSWSDISDLNKIMSRVNNQGKRI
jgi:TRAP-type mannitol/chloroaromatic compound transport system substrate-binding protein